MILEVDTRAKSLDSTRLAPEAWLGIASYLHQVQTCSRRLVFCLYAVINSIDQIRSLYGGVSKDIYQISSLIGLPYSHSSWILVF